MAMLVSARRVAVRGVCHIENFVTAESSSRASRSCSTLAPNPASSHGENTASFLSQKYRHGPEGKVSVRNFLRDLVKTGLTLDDSRFSSAVKSVEILSNDNGGVLSEDLFISTLLQQENGLALIAKAVKGELVVQDYEGMSKSIDAIYHQCTGIEGGQNASYIPELSRVDPSLWGVSLCTTDGQRHSVGDSSVLFTIQSGGKCFNYAIGCDEVGTDEVHKYIGMEPSGSHFNRMVLNTQGKPHNPMINAGALVLTSLIKPHLSLHERMDFMLSKFDELAGLSYRSIKCDMITCDSEMANCDRNMALIHYIKSKSSFPPNVSIDDTIKLYTRLCSIELDCQKGAVMAATLANGGICPLTGRQVVTNEAVQHTLTLMHSCGMYDFSGEFAFNVGLPAKSGVSGVIIVVVPRVMGICLYSPRVNTNGNSVRGLEFCRKLTKAFDIHLYGSHSGRGSFGR